MYTYIQDFIITIAYNSFKCQLKTRQFSNLAVISIDYSYTDITAHIITREGYWESRFEQTRKAQKLKIS